MKTMIHTKDIFPDTKKGNKYLANCVVKARKIGLEIVNHNLFEGGDLFIELVGTKQNMIKYYIATLKETDNICNGIKRIINIIF